MDLCHAKKNIDKHWSVLRGILMFCLIRKLFGAIKYRYDDYKNWEMKMNVPISFTIVYTPSKNTGQQKEDESEHKEP